MDIKINHRQPFLLDRRAIVVVIKLDRGRYFRIMKEASANFVICKFQ